LRARQRHLGRLPRPSAGGHPERPRRRPQRPAPRSPAEVGGPRALHHQAHARVVHRPQEQRRARPRDDGLRVRPERAQDPGRRAQGVQGLTATPPAGNLVPPPGVAFHSSPGEYSAWPVERAFAPFFHVRTGASMKLGLPAGIVFVVLMASCLSLVTTARADDETARLHFQAGAKEFEAGRYEAALASFSAAYELSGRPELLYNIALCHEELGRYGEAAVHLRRYLDEVENVPQRTALERRIEILRKAAAA